MTRLSLVVLLLLELSIMTRLLLVLLLLLELQ